MLKIYSQSQVRDEVEAARRRREPRLPSRQRGIIRLNSLFGFWARQPAGGAAPFLVDAADFDGTNDGLIRTSAFTGQSSFSQGIWSFWIKVDTAGGSIWAAHDVGGDIVKSSFTVSDQGGGLVALVCQQGGSGQSASFNMTTWHHVIIDVATGDCCVDGSRSAGAFSITQLTDSTVDTSTVAQNESSSNRFNGGLAEFYLSTGSLDLSVASNVEKFRSATGKPVDLGSTGAAPTGTAPMLFLHLGDGEAAANFATNRSGNGNMTVQGTLTTFATSPSD